jgi:ribonuclease P/MRP protein subunit RPP40
MVSQLFIRSHLEYAVSVWCPYLKKDVELLERLQHGYSSMSWFVGYSIRRSIAGLTDLEMRRKRGDMIQMYKIKHDIDNVNWYSEQSTRIHGMTSRRHDMQLRKEIVRNTNEPFNFFKNRVVTNWNKLASETVHATDINVFKASIEVRYGKLQ